MLKTIRELYERKGLDAVWKFCMEPEGAHSKAKRFAIAAHWAGNQADQEKGDEAKAWKQRQKRYREERERFEDRYEAQQHAGLPASVHFFELLYHEPGPHVHVACDFDQLVQICKVARLKGLRVGEFPPFDHVDCVHVTTSFHYRDKGAPSTPRSCSDAQNGRSSGLAADLNDLDGGSDQEYAFFLDLRRIAA